MRHLFCIFLLAGLHAIQTAMAGEGIEVNDAWINEAPPTVKLHAGYLKITNNSERGVRLIGASSESYDHIELHLSSIADGMASMQKQDSIAIAPHSEFVFSPGGYHLMLFNNQRPLREGDTVRLRLHFDRNVSLDVEAEIKKGGASDHDHNH